jgi:hypothetical protein
MYRDFICEDCLNKYSPGMFTTSQCQNLIGPTNKTKQRIVFILFIRIQQIWTNYIY